MPKAKKRVLSSSESSDSEGEKAAGKTEKTNQVVKKVKTATSSSDEQGKAAKKTKKDKAEKPEKIEKPIEKPEKPKVIVKMVKEPVKEPEKKKLAEKEPEKVVKTTTVKDMLRLQRDNMRKMEQAKPTSSGATTADEEGEIESVSSSAVSESSRDSHTETVPVNGAKEISMPENLPADTVVLINSLKAIAVANPNAKNSFFDSKVLDLLVKIDSGAKSAGASIRIQTFNYLETFVPCTKNNLFAKIRKHRLNQQETKVKSEISKLRKIVMETMPAETLKYEQDMKKHEETLTVQTVLGDTSFVSTPPRKKFHWNDNSRSILGEIVRHLRDLFKIGKSKKETEDEFILRKIQTDVLIMWPDGWVKIEDVHKELERKKKKDARVSALAQISAPNAHTKNTANPATNGKASAQAPKTDLQVKSSELEASVVNGKTSTNRPSDATSPSSVIKRSSDHSINSIISASPSPPTTSQALKAQDTSAARVIELDKLTSQSELMKVAQSTPKYSLSPVDCVKAENIRRSDSSDSDCVEIVGEFNPIKPAKSVFNHKVNHSSSAAYPAPIAKKSKTHGSDDGGDTDYQKVILGIQSLTVRTFFAY